jgi:hypothetical protein
MTGGGGRIDAAFGTIATLEFAGVRCERVEVMAAEFLTTLSTLVGTPLDGIVG